jgi:hypothetical protein
MSKEKRPNSQLIGLKAKIGSYDTRMGLSKTAEPLYHEDESEYFSILLPKRGKIRKIFPSEEEKCQNSLL